MKRATRDANRHRVVAEAAIRDTAAALAGVLCCLLITAGAAFAQPGYPENVQGYTRDTFIQWLHKYAEAKPDFKPGDILTAKDIERMRPFVPPGFLEMLNFPEFKARIVAPVDRSPVQSYIDCSEKYQSQVRLNPDRTLANYTCGQPFPDSTLDVNDPTSGMKEAWIFNYRWQNYGAAYYDIPFVWVRFGGTHVAPKVEAPPDAWVTLPPTLGEKLPSDTSELFLGGGTFQRTLQAAYRRVYFSHLSQLPTHILPLPTADDIEFKELTEFFEPFDIDGTAFITFRYNQTKYPDRADDLWAYVPNLRRVRRASAEVKSDSLLGTDHTIEDFESFSGRPMDWKWKFLGWKDVLTVEPSYVYPHLYGPICFIPDDQWSLRRTAVIERVPKDPRHPYSSAINFWDAQTHFPAHHVAFDRTGKLWKVWLWTWKWSESFTKDWSEYNLGNHCSLAQLVNVVDVQNRRATIIPLFGAGSPGVNLVEVKALYDINNLERAHR